MAGNKAAGGGPDISGTITLSNGHNVFGSDVAGDIPGDRISIAPATVFAAIDPATGGGKLSPDGHRPTAQQPAPIRRSAPATPSWRAPSASSAPPRPQPAGSLPDIGAVEPNQPLSTRATDNNDVLTGTNAANTLTGLRRHRLSQGPGRQRHARGRPGRATCSTAAPATTRSRAASASIWRPIPALPA